MQSVLQICRRDLLIGTAASAAFATVPFVARAQAPITGLPSVAKVSLTVNGVAREVELDTRTTLLDALREQFHLLAPKRAAITANAAPAR